MPEPWELTARGTGTRQQYTVQEAAEAMGVAPSTIRHYCRTGILHCEHDEHYQVRISEEEMSCLNHVLGMRAANVYGAEIAALTSEYRATAEGMPERTDVLQRMSEHIARGARNAAAYYMRLEDELAAEARSTSRIADTVL